MTTESSEQPLPLFTVGGLTWRAVLSIKSDDGRPPMRMKHLSALIAALPADDRTKLLHDYLRKAMAVVEAAVELCCEDVHTTCYLCEMVRRDDTGEDALHNQDCPLVLGEFIDRDGKRLEDGK